MTEHLERLELDLLRGVLDELTPLYSEGDADRADSILVSYPNPVMVVKGLRVLMDTMFPGKMTHVDMAPDSLENFLAGHLDQAWKLLRPEVELAIPFRWKGQAARMEGPPEPEDAQEASIKVMEAFNKRLPEVRKLLVQDVVAGYEGDPAALSYAEVQLAYPGLLAITSHRLAHELYRLDVPIVPRIMSEWTHSRTGVDIHPGATIGHSFFIDHATGVVVGETAHIGDRVKFYQGVTIGAKSFPLDEHGRPIKHIQRHPTVEDDVVVYAHATILGGDTVIGARSTIGGNVFIMDSVPPDSFVKSNHPELRIKSNT